MEEPSRKDQQSMTYTCRPPPPDDNKRSVVGTMVVLPGAVSEAPVLNQATPPPILPSSGLREAGVEDPIARPAAAEEGEDRMGQEKSKEEMPPFVIRLALPLRM